MLILHCRVLVWAFYCIDALVLKYHLFVWSVFSPKLLYEAVASVICSLVVIYFQLAMRLKGKFRKERRLRISETIEYISRCPSMCLTDNKVKECRLKRPPVLADI